MDDWSPFTLTAGGRTLASPCVEIVAMSYGSAAASGKGLAGGLRVFEQRFAKQLKFCRTGDMKAFRPMDAKSLAGPYGWFANEKILATKMLGFFAHSGHAKTDFRTPAVQHVLWGFGQPPSPKDIIEAVIASGSVALSVSSTCHNAGTDPSDATIARYLAGFMAELSSPQKKNWIETQVVPGTAATGEPVSVCQLILRHVDGNDRWGWGVQFQVRTKDGLVLPDSFKCIGAG